MPALEHSRVASAGPASMRRYRRSRLAVVSLSIRSPNALDRCRDPCRR